MKLMLAFICSRKQSTFSTINLESSAEEIYFKQHKYYVATDLQKFEALFPK